VMAVLDRLFPDPVVRLSGSDYVHTAVSQKEERWYVHIINTAGNHFNQKVYEYDHIPATGELTLELNTPKPVRKVVLQPGDRPLRFNSKGGKATVMVPPVQVHSIVQMEF